jgi:hypothetical protein
MATASLHGIHQVPGSPHGRLLLDVAAEGRTVKFAIEDGKDWSVELSR